MNGSWGAGILFRPRVLTLALQRFSLLMAAILLVAILYSAFGVSGEADAGLRVLIYALIIGTPLAVAEAYAFGSASYVWNRRWPFAVILAAKSLGYAAWIALGATIAARLTHTHDETSWQDLLLHKSTLAAAAAAALVVNGFLAACRLLGTRTLLQVLTGRYHQPRPEERLFAFVDVEGSTALAEQLGDIRFHRLLADLFHLIEITAVEAGGEIHDYIGDQVMVTWLAPRNTARPAKSTASPLHWLAALTRRLQAARAGFVARHGTMPELRIGMHVGPVVTGEVGAFRTKVTYLGDTVNTAARVEQLARKYRALALVTGPVLSRFAFPEHELVATLHGMPLLRGQQQPRAIYRIHLRGAKG